MRERVSDDGHQIETTIDGVAVTVTIQESKDTTEIVVTADSEWRFDVDVDADRAIAQQSRQTPWWVEPLLQQFGVTEVRMRADA